MKKLSEQQLEGRMKNAAARLLEKRLMVPKVFIAAAWPTVHRRVDVLAIDRAGTGDIHCVQVKGNLESAYPMLPALKALPSHFKYIALLNEPNLQIAGSIDEVALYSEDGLGRVGIIVASEDPKTRALNARILIEPERFRLGKKYYRLIDKFVESHTADWEIRERDYA